MKNKLYSLKKILFSIFIGNTIESYDFTIFLILTPQIASTFFPFGNNIFSLLTTLIASSVSFFARPIGAVIFGYIGDKYSRKKALLLSIFLMSFVTAGIGLVPSYSMIGMGAPILIFILRIIQGFCTGGEVNGAGVFIVENMENRHQAVASAFISSSNVLGILIGYIVASFVCISWMPSWAWRISFLLGSTLSICGFYIRTNIEENKYIVNIIKKEISILDIIFLIKNNIKKIFDGLLVSGYSSMLFYTIFSFMNIYLTSVRGWLSYQSLIVCSTGMITYGIFSPLAAKIAKKYGVVKIMIISLILTMILAYTLFSLISSKNYYYVLFAEFLFSLLAASFSGPSKILLVKIFPIKIRYMAGSLSYNVGVALFGGTITPLLTYVSCTKFEIVAYFYIIIISLPTLWILINIKRKRFLRPIKIFYSFSYNN